VENNVTGVYVMQVAAMLTGLHPQTLRKYERAGLLSPSRQYTIRFYSDEDIERLKMIKHLVNDMGLNLAGVDIVLKIRDKLLEIKDEVTSADLERGIEERICSLLEEALEILEESGVEANTRVTQ